MGHGVEGARVEPAGASPHSRPQGAQDLSPSLLGTAGGNGPVPLPGDGPKAHGAECCSTELSVGCWVAKV